MRVRTVEIGVGAFMLVGILALAFLAVQVSGLNLRDNNRETYKLSARFNNVSGLGVRAKVAMAGVNIGRVTGIHIDPSDTMAVVDMAIDKRVDYLTRDTIAAIQTQGILGEKYISLSVGGDPDMLGDGDEIEDTQSALVLEDLIGKFISNVGKN
jgi:phospholipid/cholesterol/gamma-HCH transport system substrate-binding protein